MKIPNMINRFIETKCSIYERLRDIHSTQVISLYDFALLRIESMSDELNPDDLTPRFPTEILIDIFIMLIEAQSRHIEKLTPHLLYQMIKTMHKRHEMYQLFQRIFKSVTWLNFLKCTYETVCTQLRFNNMKFASEMCVLVANFLSECGSYLEAINFYDLNLNECKRVYETNRDPAVLEWILLCATKLHTAYLAINDLKKAKTTIILIHQCETFITNPNYNRTMIYLQYLKYYWFGTCFSDALHWCHMVLDEINDSVNVKLVIEVLRSVSHVYNGCGRVSESNLLVLYAEKLAVTYDLSYWLYLRIAIDKIDSSVHNPNNEANQLVDDTYEAFLDETENVFGDECFKYAQACHTVIEGCDKYLKNEPIGTQRFETVQIFAEEAYQICESYLPFDNDLVMQASILKLSSELGDFLNAEIVDEHQSRLAGQLADQLWYQEMMYKTTFGDESAAVPRNFTNIGRIFQKIGFLHLAYLLYTESNVNCTRLYCGWYCLHIMWQNWKELRRIYEASSLHDLVEHAETCCQRVLTEIEALKEDPNQSFAASYVWNSISETVTVKKFKTLLDNHISMFETMSNT